MVKRNPQRLLAYEGIVEQIKNQLHKINNYVTFLAGIFRSVRFGAANADLTDTALRAGRLARVDRDPDANQHIADVREAGIRQQPLDLLLPQREQVTSGHVQRAEQHQQLAPRAGHPRGSEG